jgi:GTP-binding protein YchF
MERRRRWLQKKPLDYRTFFSTTAARGTSTVYTSRKVIMKLGIVGLPGAGKSTIFEALTRNIQNAAHRAEDRLAVVKVPDPRIDFLSAMYEPLKTIYAQIEYFLPGQAAIAKGGASNQPALTPVRDCDAMIHVIRNPSAGGTADMPPDRAFAQLDQEWILADLISVEKRLERLELDHQRGKKMNPEEHSLLSGCRDTLEKDIALRDVRELASAPLLRGFAFLSAKPVLVLFNNDDDNPRMPEVPELTSQYVCLAVRGKLEQELAQMKPEEAAEFMQAYNIDASAMDRVIKRSYQLLGLVSFFTVGKDEVRAWTIRTGTTAVDAADVIHSDIKKGFIRAEVLAYEDLRSAGSHQAARKTGTVRLEGKNYLVRDGDIINFRFNV